MLWIRFICAMRIVLLHIFFMFVTRFEAPMNSVMILISRSRHLKLRQINWHIAMCIVRFDQKTISRIIVCRCDCRHVHTTQKIVFHLHAIRIQYNFIIYKFSLFNQSQCAKQSRRVFLTSRFLLTILNQLSIINSIIHWEKFLNSMKFN